MQETSSRQQVLISISTMIGKPPNMSKQLLKQQPQERPKSKTNFRFLRFKGESARIQEEEELR